MSQAELGEVLRAVRYERGQYADRRARLQFIARVYDVLQPGSVSHLIFKTTVVSRLPYKIVARELSISLRQFFRLRNHMIEEIGSGLETAHVEAVAPVNDDRVQLELARRALDHGHVQSAEETLAAVMTRNPAAPDLIEALLLRARAACERGASAEAEILVDEATRAVGRCDASAHDELRRDLALMRAYALYRNGAYDAALELSERALPVHAVTPSSDPYVARKHARQSLFLAIEHEEGGSPERALEYLRAALHALESLEQPPAAEIAQVYVHRAFVRAGLPSEATAAPRDAAEAIRLAEWHGLTAELVWANLALAMATYASNPEAAVTLWAARAIRLGQEHLTGDPLARTLFIGSRFECAADRPHDAVRHVLDALPHVANDLLLQSVYHLAEARARHANGDFDRSIASATRAIDMMERRSRSHYIGLAYLKRGSARHRQGNAFVRDDVEAAIHYLERGAPLNDRLEALALSADVTLNRVHRREAEELRHLLAAAAG